MTCVRQVCRLCVLDDDVTWVPLGDGVYEYTCSAARRHKSGQPYIWKGTSGTVLSNSPDQEGPAGELGMLDDLLKCVHDGEGWVEYGIVEARYRDLNPAAFELRQMYGHRTLGPPIKKGLSASAYIARVLGMLRDRDFLSFRGGPATGEWSYNGYVSYWAKPPAPPESRTQTWLDYSADG